MRNKIGYYIIAFITVLLIMSASPSNNLQIALLKYNGGGDWYANPTALPNLVKFCNKVLRTNIREDIATVEVGSKEIFNYPYLHMTGHGNVVFSPQEVDNLRAYLIGGGFLHISDNYGMDQFIRTQMNKVFPDIDFVELPFSHPIYHQRYNFSKGLPKIHEHDGSRPQGLGIIFEGRVVCFYDYECDLGDGWEDADVHHDSEQKRQEALQMGANIIQFVFNQ
jgi:hypothetical protein